MKKFLSILSCTFIWVVLFVGSVDAATLSVGSDTTTAGALNKSVTLELKDDDLSNYSKVSFELGIVGTTDAEILKFSYSGRFTYTPNGDGFVIGDEKVTLQPGSLGTISYKTVDNFTGEFKIVATNVVFTTVEGNEMHVGDSGIKVEDGIVKCKSTDASLTSINVSQGVLSPEFNKDTFEYTTQVKDTINVIKISATPSTGATVTGTGNKTLLMGENKYEIVVTAEDGTTKNTYTINVIRGEITEPSAYFKSLIINNIGVVFSPEFDPKNNKYTIKVDEDITELDFKYELEDPLAVVTIEGNEDFKVGENLVTIKVVSSNEEDEQIYEITVIKEEVETVTETPSETVEKEEEKESKLWLIILIIGGSVLILLGVIFLLFRGKKKPKGKQLKSNVVNHEEDYLPTHAKSSSDTELDYDSKEEGTTQRLEENLYDDERTQRFDSSILKEFDYQGSEEDIDKTKEFDFKDLQ